MKFISTLTTFLAIAFAFGIVKSQESDSDPWRDFLNSVKWMKEDIYVGGGVNSSGIYMSKYRNNTSMGFGIQGFVGAYLPYSENLFFHGQLGISQSNFKHHTPLNGIDISMVFLELPIFISAQLPISSKIETRLIVGWQGNWAISKRTRGSYSEAWSANPESLVYERNQLMDHDFGFYFGLGTEYGRWLLRGTGFIGINNLVKNDTGMLNTFKIDVGYFIFRKK